MKRPVVPILQQRVPTVDDLFDGFIFKFRGIPLHTHNDFFLRSNISPELSTLDGGVHVSTRQKFVDEAFVIDVLLKLILLVCTPACSRARALRGMHWNKLCGAANPTGISHKFASVIEVYNKVLFDSANGC